MRLKRINKKERRGLGDGRSRVGDKLLSPCLHLIIAGFQGVTSRFLQVFSKTLCITMGFCDFGSHAGVKNA